MSNKNNKKFVTYIGSISSGEVKKAIDLFNTNRIFAELSSDQKTIVVELENIKYTYYIQTGRWLRKNEDNPTSNITGKYISIFSAIRIDKEYQYLQRKVVTSRLNEWFDQKPEDTNPKVGFFKRLFNRK